MSDSPRTAALLLTFARRGEEEAIRQALAALREAAPGADIVAIGTPVSTPVLKNLGVDDIITYGDGRGARSVVREARGRRPAAAAVVYWGPGFSAHLKLELLALLCGPPRVLRLAPEALVSAIGRPRLALSVIGKTLAAGALALAGAALCGTALICLRLRQILAGGHRAPRA
ncbi:MAG TPA: hypothetical protein VMY87_11080 [Armatimonadota bacterium]|nr:hypothetical protein [Armatimonadota bacterium]